MFQRLQNICSFTNMLLINGVLKIHFRVMEEVKKLVFRLILTFNFSR